MRGNAIKAYHKRSVITQHRHCNMYNSITLSRFRSQQRRSVTKVMINLLDSNDNNPQFLPTNTYQFIVDGNSSVGAAIGQVRRNGELFAYFASFD